MALVPSRENNLMTSELYFLISKFLAAGPLKETAQVLNKELQEFKILPKRLDWEGNEHEQTFDQLERRYPHIGPEHILEICGRLGPILDRDVPPSIRGVVSLLGAGRQSLLRTNENVIKPWTYREYIARQNQMPLAESRNKKNVYNLVRVLHGRESSGPISRRVAVGGIIYTKIQLLRRTLGHLSAVYCLLFDRTGRYIITGADDLLVKLWSAIDGRLLATFRGASAEITDIAINFDNTLLAAGSLDCTLRVWELQSTGPIAVLMSHTGMITSVNFCPSPRGDLRYLITTSTDGSIAFWSYTYQKGTKPIFVSKPFQYFERMRPGHCQMICASFSPGGMFLAAGSADHHVRVYIMHSDEGPKRILEMGAHSDAVDSIQWANNGLRFVSGSKDGSALIWHFESQQWKYQKLLMNTTIPGQIINTDDGKKLKVTMVSWNCTDKWIITAVNDHSIKVWYAETGELTNILCGHKDEVYVLESHPKDPNIILSAGHDGQIFIWNILAGTHQAVFLNNIEGQGHGSVFDAKWSPDGTMIAGTDSHGHILMYGLGTGHPLLKTLPKELFFHTDYRPLIRDANHYVLDEQTQTAPHLMPPPFLVDVDGNPHPPALQRLVPGREQCPSDQLVPNIAVGAGGQPSIIWPSGRRPIIFEHEMRVLNYNEDEDEDIDVEGTSSSDDDIDEDANDYDDNYVHYYNYYNYYDDDNNSGMQEVIEGMPHNHHEPRSDIDRMIQALALRQYGISDQNNAQNIEGLNGQDDADQLENDAEFDIIALRFQLNSPRSNRVGLRRNGDVEGVRQSSGNWQRDGSLVFSKRSFLKPMNPATLHTAKLNIMAAGANEMEQYRSEMKRRPVMINTAAGPSCSTTIGVRTRRQPRQAPRYRTRAAREALDEVDSTVMTSSEESERNTDDEAVIESSSSDTESSEYSDWVADQPGLNLEPPQRSKRKRVQKKTHTPIDSDDDRRIPNMPQIAFPPGNEEIPEMYKPPEWLSEVIPRKAPYYPQMGDEVVYWCQGHQRYLDAVKNKNVYDLGNKCKPWDKIEIRDHELVKVVGIKYEIRPPRLCCLKLAMMESNGQLTGQHFTIKYHDMADVLDFLVLKQTYDTALSRNWSPGDRFRCMIDDGWWMGQIESQKAISSMFPDSLFMSLRVRWDNGEYEYMSPWDLEPINEDRLPLEVGGAVPVLPEEIQATLYQPCIEEWPRGDRDATCRRILTGLEQVMSLAIAEPFVAPVDLGIYPSYAYIVEYPIDLSTIKGRFDNRFYRRVTSAQFDVRYLATNAEKFNKSHSNIVKQARIVTDLCLRIIREEDPIDVPAVYHQLVATYESSDSEDNDSPTPGPSTDGLSHPGARRSRRLVSQYDWKLECRELLGLIWQCEDSTPFREAVDIIQHPDYHQIIDTPMDLQSIKEDLLGDNYESPSDFARDMRLIFSNSKNYNTNKKSRIYSMTLRLSTLFEAHMKVVMCNFKAAKRRTDALKMKNGQQSINTRASSTAVIAGPSGVNNRSSESDDEDNEPLARSAYKTNTDSMNGHSRPVRGMSHSSTSDSDSSGSRSDSDLSDSVPIASLKGKSKAKPPVVHSDSEDSYKPQQRNKRPIRKVSRKAKSSPPVDSDDSDEKPNTRTRGKHSQNFDSEQSNSNSRSAGIKTRMQISATNNIEVSEYAQDSDATSVSEQSIKPTRRTKYESDHSYHLEDSKSRRSQYFSETDDDKHENEIRPSTRGSAKKTQQYRTTVTTDEESQLDPSPGTSGAGPSGTQGGRTRRGKRPHYKEQDESDDDDTNSVSMTPIKRRNIDIIIEQPSPVSISSRGRVRKLTPKARGLGILRD